MGVEGSRSELKSECADPGARIFFTRVLSGCYVILTSPKEGETAVYGIAAFCLQNLICLLFIFADQVFIDPTFFGIFVCGPLQSFVVNV